MGVQPLAPTPILRMRTASFFLHRGAPSHLTLQGTSASNIHFYEKKKYLKKQLQVCLGVAAPLQQMYHTLLMNLSFSALREKQRLHLYSVQASINKILAL